MTPASTPELPAVLFAYLGHGWRGLGSWVSDLLDPNMPLSSKIVSISAPFILAFIVYKLRNQKNSTNNPSKSQVGIKKCPYCGAEYAKGMTLCPLDQSALILK